MALDKGQKALVKRLMQEIGWDILVGACLAEYLDKLEQNPVNGSNEFETLRELHTRQGKKAGLTEFFSEVEKMNFD